MCLCQVSTESDLPHIWLEIAKHQYRSVIHKCIDQMSDDIGNSLLKMVKKVFTLDFFAE